jgi:ankyrin repeat protein
MHNHTHGELAHLLLERGAASNSREPWDRTPLSIAVENEALDLARMLLEHGASPHPLDGDTDPPLAVALKRGKEEVLELLLEFGADPSLPHPLHGSHLMHAVDLLPHLGQDSRLIRRLVEAGADLRLRDALGDTLLQKAVEASDQELLAVLLKHGADLNSENDLGSTALRQACSAESVEMVAALCEAGADPNRGSGVLGPPLVSTALNGNVAVLRLLLRHGARIPSADEADGNQEATYTRSILLDLAERGGEVSTLLREAGCS